MKTSPSSLGLHIGLLAALFLATGATAQTDKAPTLKDAYKGHFSVGVAINRSIVTGGAPGFGNRPAGQVGKDIALTKEQFNQVSPENDLKWESIHPREGADGYNFGPADAYVEFGVKNHMVIVGHTLVWHGQTPNWVFSGAVPPPGAAGTGTTPPAPPPPAGAASPPSPVPPIPFPPANGPGGNPGGPVPPGGPRRRGFGGGFGYNGPRATREELLQRMHDHIQTVVGRYKGKIQVWDVVNECVSDGGPDILRNSLWRQIIGPDFIAKAFEYAHEADPKAILRLNDYSLENPAKRQKFITLVRQLQAQKVPISAIGTQTHVSVSSPSFAEEDQELTDLETLGLPIHVTELDVNGAQAGQQNTGADVANNAATTQGGLVSDADQHLADQYAALFRAFLKHKSVKVVTFWGINDGVSWRAAGKPLLFDAGDQPKPAFGAVIRAAKGDVNASAQEKSVPDKNFYVFLSFGQSNMEGFPGVEDQDKGPVDARFRVLAAVDFPDQDRQQGQWYTAVPPLARPGNGIGPSDYFGRTLAAHLPAGIKVGVVNVSVAGCKIEMFDKDHYTSYAETAPPWMKGIIAAYGGDPYQRLVDMAKVAQKDGVIKGILLHQGESNTNDREWPNKVKGVYDNLIKDLDLDPKQVPLLAGELLGADQSGACASMNAIIDDLPKTIPNSYVVSSAGCPGRPDHLHFTPAGYRTLGTRYGEKMLSLLGHKAAAPH